LIQTQVLCPFQDIEKYTDRMKRQQASTSREQASVEQYERKRAGRNTWWVWQRRDWDVDQNQSAIVWQCNCDESTRPAGRNGVRTSNPTRSETNIHNPKGAIRASGAGAGVGPVESMFSTHLPPHLPRRRRPRTRFRPPPVRRGKKENRNKGERAELRM
jgi:hypothetical protein